MQAFFFSKHPVFHFAPNVPFCPDFLYILNTYGNLFRRCRQRSRVHLRHISTPLEYMRRCRIGIGYFDIDFLYLQINAQQLHEIKERTA